MSCRLRTSHAFVTVIALVAMAVTACGGSSSKSSAGNGFAGSVRTPPLQVASVVMPDVLGSDTGRDFAMRGPAGGYLLVYFGYTHCADQCPLTLGNLSAAVHRLPAERRAKVTIAFATVDPARDTVAVLRSYVAHWPATIHLLRATDTTTLSTAQHKFRVTSSPTRDMHGSIDHSASTAVVDEHGTVVLEWPFGLSTKAIAGDLDRLFAGRSAVTS